MTYNPNIPAAGTRIDQTFSLITTNFSQANTIFGQDHVEFNNVTSANRGKHNKSTYLELGADPTTAANEVALYAKVGTNPAESNLFFRGESNGFVYQMTKAISASTSVFANNTNYSGNNNGGWTFLPGGLVIQYGRKTSPGTSGTVTFPISFPSGSNPFSIVITNERNSIRGLVLNQANISDSSFDYIFETGGSAAINWIAIGN